MGSHANLKSKFHDFSMTFQDKIKIFHDYFLRSCGPVKRMINKENASLHNHYHDYTDSIIHERASVKESSELVSAN